MTRLAANLSLMFAEVPFLDRFTAAANAGFEAVEFMFPYAETPDAIAGQLKAHGLELALFNMPAGAWQEGETAGHDPPASRENFHSKDIHASDLALKDGVQILLEPINTRVDIPGYFYDNTAAAMALIAEAGRSNLRLQYDIYHMQIMEGDLARTIERLLPAIGHVQLADNPGRHEPGTGEINYPWLLARLDALGYAGFVGCEYLPANGTLEGLGWAQPYLHKDAI